MKEKFLTLLSFFLFLFLFCGLTLGFPSCATATVVVHQSNLKVLDHTFIVIGGFTEMSTTFPTTTVAKVEINEFDFDVTPNKLRFKGKEYLLRKSSIIKIDGEKVTINEGKYL